jgi:hypothetical protein
LIEPLGGWSIEWKTFVYILSHLPFGSTILELGSGRSSGELSRFYKVYSVEHADHYINMYETNYIKAEIKNNWYDREVMKTIPKYDLLLVDGPDAYHRPNFYHNLDLFDLSKPIIIDDMQEPELLEDAKKFAQETLRRPYEILDGEIKKFMVIP